VILKDGGATTTADAMPTAFARYANRLRNRAIYRRVRPFTMIAKYGRFEDNLLVAERHLRKNPLAGAYVECGVWRGGMSFAMMQILPKYGITDYHFFDSFEGLPEVTEKDGAEARAQQDSDAFWHDNNAADYTQFLSDLQNFKPDGVTTSVYRGWFEDTLAEYPADRPIALLRLDCDWFDSITCCLETLWDRVVPGGLVLLDAYYDWSGCSNAVHSFLTGRFAADHDFQCPVHESKYGLAYLVKPE
jgi:O-methyltransferase